MQKALSLTSRHLRLSFAHISKTVPAKTRMIPLCHNFTRVPMAQNPWSSIEQTAGSSRTTSSLSISGSDILASFSKEEREEFEGKDVAGAMVALANADAVCFDVDSTVITEEGIDVLAESLGKGEEVAAWTLKAMEGNTKFEDALAARLEIIKPSQASIEKCLKDHPLQFSPGVERLVESLNVARIDVYLISGGFRSMIEPIARELCVGKSNIIANTILYHKDGGYAGFDREELTSRDMGKPKAVQKIKEENGYKTIIMVGDGATDAQAKPPANAFIGFGGVSVRESVREKACWYVKDFESMNAVVEKFAKSA